MGTNLPRHGYLHGHPDVAVSRYFALYSAQVGWLALGFYLLSNAYWPSSCRPDGFVQVYECSLRLADQRGWIESSLMTWLWSTPILVALEVSRHWERFKARRAARTPVR